MSEKIKHSSGVTVTKEQDKAFAGFSKFFGEVVEKSRLLHMETRGPVPLLSKEQALRDLGELLHKNFNWNNVLSKEDMNKMLRELRN